MPITSKNIAKHEVVGLRVKVQDALNPNYVGIEGEVIKESKNMLYIRSGDKVRAVSKRGSVFVFDVDGKLIKVLGDVLIGRAEERIKKRVKRWKVLEGEL